MLEKRKNERDCAFGAKILMPQLGMERERFYPVLIMTLTATVVLGTLVFDSAAAGAYILWGLGAAMAFFAIREAAPKARGYDIPVAWGLLLAGGMTALLLPSLSSGWASWLGICALCAYSGGVYMLVRLALPALILVLVVPSSGFLYLLLSFPLSRICTILTVGILRLVGIPCSFEQAIIYVGENRIAVTSACSGIELLEAMLLLGWLITHFEQKTLQGRFLHFLTLVPAIVLANTLRLVVVILLSLSIGGRAFEDPLHTILGYCVVLLTVFLMLGTGKIVRKWEAAAHAE